MTKFLYLCIMETFLESVAKVYYNNYQDDCHSLADVLFVFPGKRAGSFFLKSLKEHGIKIAVGSSGNTMTEALKGIRLFGEVLSDELLN